MVEGHGAGKGPKYRKVDLKKWDAWWKKYGNKMRAKSRRRGGLRGPMA